MKQINTPMDFWYYNIWNQWLECIVDITTQRNLYSVTYCCLKTSNLLYIIELITLRYVGGFIKQIKLTFYL